MTGQSGECEGMATIKDVAKRANVSIATVSMVLNDKDCITKKTKMKVLQAAKELNYIPSFAAKTLKTNRSHAIALFAGDIGNPFFQEIIKGVEAAAIVHDYSVIIYDMSYGNFAKELRRAVSQQVDGIFITGAWRVDDEVRELLLSILAKGVKIVSCNQYMDWGVFPIIYTEEGSSVDMFLSKLVAYGHQHIGCVSVPETNWVSIRREGHYKRVLEQYGLYHPEYIVRGGFTIEEGKEAAKRLLLDYPQITAIMCISDMIAIGGNAAALELGRKVPQELSIFGVDGIECLKYFYPEIATVDTRRYEYGYGGTERLVALMREGEEKDPKLLEPLAFQCRPRMGDTIVPPAQR